VGVDVGVGVGVDDEVDELVARLATFGVPDCFEEDPPAALAAMMMPQSATAPTVRAIAGLLLTGRRDHNQ